MKERPILFNEKMVSAIIEGRKTQTRRIINPQPASHLNPDSVKAAWDAGFVNVKCPFGQTGDYLWVRETFTITTNPFESENKIAIFRENVPERMRDQFKWKPSIHMPRRASRIDLKITNIRVEKLQDISDEDAKSEGCDKAKDHPLSIGYRQSFQSLWSSINGSASWDENPWVWVIEFKKI